MPVKDLDLLSCCFDRQRFLQFSPMDLANFYPVSAKSGKRKVALYPCMGRRHIQNKYGTNVLNFNAPPRRVFTSIDFMYVVVGATVYQVDSALTAIPLTNAQFTNPSSTLSFAYLPLVQGASPTSQTQAVFCGLCDGQYFYIIDENNQTMTTVTDPLTPPNPNIVVAFGNRFAVSTTNSTEFRLTQINCYDPTTMGFNPNGLFHVPSTPTGQAVFAQESGLIRQMCVLHNTLYIFSDYECGIWSNIPSYISSNSIGNAVFPWKKNTSLNFDYGIADPNSLDVDFGRMVWLAQNKNGLVTFMMSTGQLPVSISTQAVNVLLQNTANTGFSTQFLNYAFGFLYQYEDTIFYRVTSGPEDPNTGVLYDSAEALEYNFDTNTWGRCIEVDGDRNIIQDHVFFQDTHIVTAIGQPSLFEMAGNIYINEIRNPNESDPQAFDAFIAYPMRYELVSKIICEEFYQEFMTKWVQIDMVWGEQTFISSTNPFLNTVFIISETAGTDGQPIYLVAEDGQTFIITENSNYPVLDEPTYNALFKPHIELYCSDDGGITFYTVDSLEFSQLGVFSWRMRWYQCGLSRNRVYKLVCVSPSPIVILGAIHETEIVSGGAY